MERYRVESRLWLEVESGILDVHTSVQQIGPLQLCKAEEDEDGNVLSGSSHDRLFNNAMGVV